MFKLKYVAIAVALASSAQAMALDKGESKFSGFGTVGFTQMGGESEGRSYGMTGQVNDSLRGDSVSKLAGQFQYGLTDSVDLTAQVVAKADQDKWGAKLEWLYASWSVNDQLTLRAGRLRDPVYMYSETLDVGFTYPWLRLPDEVYSQVQITNYEGLDMLYSFPVSYGSINLQLAGGQAKNRDFFAFDEKFDMDYDKLAAASLTVDTNEFGTFRLGYSEADLTIERILKDRKGKFSSVGYRFDNGDWLGATEMTRMVVEGETASKNAFYVMTGKRLGKYMPHITFAQYEDEKAGTQRSMTYGLNYQLAPTITLKGEYKRVDTQDRSAGQFIKNKTDLTNEAIYGMSGGLLGSAQTGYDADIFSVGVDFVF